MATELSTKSGRLDLRVSAQQKRLIEEAAAASDTTVSEFVLASAASAAQAVLADRTAFRLSRERWTAFAEAIDRPARDLPRLAELLATRTVLEPE